MQRQIANTRFNAALSAPLIAAAFVPFSFAQTPPAPLAVLLP